MSCLNPEIVLVGLAAMGFGHGGAVQAPRRRRTGMMKENDVSDQINAADYGFSPAVESGGFLFCSGQVGMELDGSVPTDPGRQYYLAFQALQALLEQHGCEVGDIVDLTTFHVGYPQHMDIFMTRKAAFQGTSSPAWTAIGVAALGHPQSLVEIKAIARIRGAQL